MATTHPLSYLEEFGSGFSCKLLGSCYERLLVPIFEAEGLVVKAGKPIDGQVTRPKICPKDKPTGWPQPCDYLRYEPSQEKWWLVEAKCWAGYQVKDTEFRPKYHLREDRLVRENYVYPSFFERRKVFIGRSQPPIEQYERELLWWRTPGDAPLETNYRGFPLRVRSIRELLWRGRKHYRDQLAEFEELATRFFANLRVESD